MGKLKELSAFENLVVAHTIQDFYTPNIKAEVILDMLLTPYIPAIIEAATGQKATLITKEMSIGYAKGNEIQEDNNRGKKVDYVVMAKENVLFVELKTTQGSLESAQIETYRKWIDKDNPKKGTDLLHLLCRILKIKYMPEKEHPYTILKSYLSKKLTKNSIHRKAVCTEVVRDRLVEDTHAYQKKNYIHGTEKYLHTIACILQNTNPEDWEKDIKIIYISPSGANTADIQDITFKWIIKNIDCPVLKDLKESVCYNHILVPLFSQDSQGDTE